MKQSFLIALLSGLRSRVFQSLFAVGVLAMGAAFLAGGFSPRQPGTVTLDVGLSLIRAVTLVLVLYWAYELIGKEIERRTIYVSLAYPVTRGQFLLGRYLGILVLTTLAVVLLGAMLAAVVMFSGWGYDQTNPFTLTWPYVLTLLALLLDLAVVASFGFLVASVSVTPFVPLVAGLAFAISARSLGPAFEYLSGMTSGQAELQATMTPIFEWLRWILPDLSRLDIRYYPLYAYQPDPGLLAGSALMAIGYTGVLLALAVMFFNRRQFN